MQIYDDVIKLFGELATNSAGRITIDRDLVLAAPPAVMVMLGKSTEYGKSVIDILKTTSRISLSLLCRNWLMQAVILYYWRHVLLMAHPLLNWDILKDAFPSVDSRNVQLQAEIQRRHLWCYCASPVRYSDYGRRINSFK